MAPAGGGSHLTAANVRYVEPAGSKWRKEFDRGFSCSLQKLNTVASRRSTNKCGIPVGRPVSKHGESCDGMGV